MRLQTVENSGMTCLGVLQNIFNVAFDTHVVTLAGSRCQLYEFGNEPDYNGISIESYLEAMEYHHTALAENQSQCQIYWTSHVQ